MRVVLALKLHAGVGAGLAAVEQIVADVLIGLAGAPHGAAVLVAGDGDLAAHLRAGDDQATGGTRGTDLDAAFARLETGLLADVLRASHLQRRTAFVAGHVHAAADSHAGHLAARIGLAVRDLRCVIQ